MDYPDVQLLIDGKWRAGAAGRTIPIVNPATEEVIGHVARAEIADLDAALAAAEVGFALWRNISAFERAKVLRRAGDLLRERLERIASLMTLEQGKPLSEARIEVLAAADTLDWFAEESRRAYGRVVPARASNITNLVLKEPVGPVAAFSPWNFPLNQIVRKLGAALAAGCSIIVKAPEETPASPAELIRAVVDAGVPALKDGKRGTARSILGTQPKGQYPVPLSWGTIESGSNASCDLPAVDAALALVPLFVLRRLGKET